MKLAPLAICAALLVSVAAGDAAAAGGFRGSLTPEERFLYVQEARGLNWRDLNGTQRCERMREVRRARAAMRPADVAKLKQRLDAEWQAMPAAEQQRIEQRLAARRARMAQNTGARNRPRCPGVNGG